MTQHHKRQTVGAVSGREEGTAGSKSVETKRSKTKISSEFEGMVGYTSEFEK